MGRPATAARILETATKTTDTERTKFLEQQLETQVELINQAERTFNALLDMVIDAEGVVADENIDDMFHLADMKDEIGGVVGQINTWRENQAAE